MLDFEHIVQVNDLSNDTLLVMTRNQLWQGLVLRARNPERFNHALTCESEDCGKNQFYRRIRAGDARFEEYVTLHPEQQIITQTTERTQQIVAESVTTIEEPEPNSLFVRFHYRRELDSNDAQVDVGEHLKSAYVQVDRDAVAMIRMLAESKLLDATVN